MSNIEKYLEDYFAGLEFLKTYVRSLNRSAYEAFKQRVYDHRSGVIAVKGTPLRESYFNDYGIAELVYDDCRCFIFLSQYTNEITVEIEPKEQKDGAS